MPTDPDPLLDPAAANARLRDNRARVLAGEHILPEEYGPIIAAIRASRLAAAQADLRRPRASAKKPTAVSLDDLLKA
jgi:hypothetical protein